MTTNNKVTEIFNITQECECFLSQKKDNHNTTTRIKYI